MAIDFYDLLDANKKKILFEISQDDFDEIEFAFSRLRKKTGVYIDAYGKSRIYRNHVELLVSFMTESMKEATLDKRKTLSETIAKFKIVDKGFLTEGD
jgi:transcriptional antiterminator Rof (Rho-off)